MALGDNPFDMEIINVRERPLSSDVNQQTSLDAATVRFLLQHMLGFRSVNSNANGSLMPAGAIADGLKVDPGSGLQVQLRSGLYLFDGTGDQPSNINGALNLNDTQPLKPGVLTSTESITVPSADPTNPRWDIVEVQYDRQVLNPQSRGVLNLSTGVFDPTLVDKTLSFLLNGLSTVNGSGPINYKTGTPAGSPSVPSTDAGYTRIGRVYVPAAASSITKDLIIDDRKLVTPGGIVRVSAVATINHSTWAITEFECNAPPGVDVVLYTYSSSGVVGLQVLGPFPNIAGITRVPMSVKVVSKDLTHWPGTWEPSINFARWGAGSLALFPTGAPTASAPSGVLNGGNSNVAYNSVRFEGSVFEWDPGAAGFSTAWNTPTADFIIAFTVDIPVI